MALRLRKDVQKASYYVWFLGAQEAKALRGTRTLLPMIPRMVEKSKEQEPLKVTLQVSHKGLKIVQVGRCTTAWCLAWCLRVTHALQPTYKTAALLTLPFPLTGLGQTLYSARGDHLLGADGRHCRLHAAAVQSGHQVSAARARLPLRLGADRPGPARPAAGADQQTGKPETIHRTGSTVSYTVVVVVCRAVSVAQGGPVWRPCFTYEINNERNGEGSQSSREAGWLC